MVRVVVNIMPVHGVAGQLCIDLHARCKGHATLQDYQLHVRVINVLRRRTTTDATTAKGTSLET